MPLSLAVRATPAAEARVDHAWQQCVSDMRWAEHVFTTYRDTSYISRLGRDEIGLSDCPPEVSEVLALGQRAEEESAGAFTIRPGGRLDPSGVVKGWAAERSARAFAGLGADWCLSAGGDLLCSAPSGVPWTIGIEDPHRPERVIARLAVSRGAVATSGAAHRGAHVVDGRTGRPARHWASVTVVAPTLTWADICATAAFALGPEAEGWLATRPVAGYLLVDTTGDLHASTTWAA